MARGEGKGWAKGRTAKDDPRIARAAAAHRGMHYVPRLSAAADKRRKTGPAVITWTPAFAYAIGLMATDGCIAGGDHISFPSADRELVELFATCLGKANAVARFETRAGGTAYRVQFGDVRFCRWLPTIGVTARKSLTLGAIAVPDAHLLSLVRGLLDGDGSVMNKVARADTHGRAGYVWEYLQTKFTSASRAHLEWLGTRLHDALGVDGLILTLRQRGERRACYQLRYGKRASHVLLAALYSDASAPRLTRKWLIWHRYLDRHPEIRID